MPLTNTTKKVATKKTSSVVPSTPSVEEVNNMSRHDALVYLCGAVASGAFARKDINVTELDMFVFKKAKMLLELIEKETDG